MQVVGLVDEPRKARGTADLLTRPTRSQQLRRGKSTKTKAPQATKVAEQVRSR